MTNHSGQEDHNPLDDNDTDQFPRQAEALRKQLLVVQDVASPCPYLSATTARMPLHYSRRHLSGSDTDQLLEGGFRRSGRFLYYTACAPCHACEPTRVNVDDFSFTKSMKRVLAKADKDLTLVWQEPRLDAQRVRLYNEHRRLRGLGTSEPIDAEEYASFLLDSCFQTVELEICDTSGNLVAISIMDVGCESISAVYTYFDPAAARYSPGTLSVLSQIKWAQEHNRQWAYLGLYVHENRHLNYKSRFQPQQRLLASQWQDIKSPE